MFSQKKTEKRVPGKNASKLKREDLSKAVPGSRNWHTTDEDEVNRRRLRAIEEQFTLKNLSPKERIFSNFQVASASGMTYCVEVRSLADRQYSCTCTDFRVNGLNSCKHVEALLLNLEARFPALYEKALNDSSTRIDIIPHLERDTLFVETGLQQLNKKIRTMFDNDGFLVKALSPEDAYEKLLSDRSDGFRLSQETAPWIEKRRRAAERMTLRRDYEQKVHAGVYPLHETRVPLPLSSGRHAAPRIYRARTAG